MYHTGSRGFGHGLASYYFEQAREELGLKRGRDGPRATSRRESRHWRAYKNAVAAGGNFAIANRLLIGRAVAGAFAETFGGEAEMVYEISHNLVQEESHPDLFDRPVWVHRKGATRALPAGHPLLSGHALGGDGPPGPHPGVHGRLRPTCCGRCRGPPARCTRSTTAPAAASRAPRPAARSRQGEADRTLRELGVHGQRRRPRPHRRVARTATSRRRR